MLRHRRRGRVRRAGTEWRSKERDAGRNIMIIGQMLKEDGAVVVHGELVGLGRQTEFDLQRRQSRSLAIRDSRTSSLITVPATYRCNAHSFHIQTRIIHIIISSLNIVIHASGVEARF